MTRDRLPARAPGSTDAVPLVGADFSPRRGLGKRRRLRTDQETEGEREQDEVPMAHNRAFRPHLVVGPTQLMLDRFIEVLNPVAQTVELVDLVSAHLRKGEGGG